MKSSWATCSRRASARTRPGRRHSRPGLPDTIAAFTVNKVCGSGLKAVMLAAQAIRAGDAEMIVAGGMESMSRAPYLLFGARAGWKYGDQKAVDAMIHDGLWCAFEDWHMGAAAEHIADQVRRQPGATKTASACRAISEPPPPGKKASFNARGRAGHGWQRCQGEDHQPRRGHAARYDCGSAGKVEAVVPRGRDGDGRQFVHAQRRRRGRGGRIRAARPGAWGSSRWPASWPMRPAASLPKDIFLAPVSAVRQVLDKAALTAKGHRPVRAERGVRRPDAGLQRRAEAG